MKKVNIFLMSILAICCSFVMMSPKSYQSSYAYGNDSIGTFSSYDINIYGGYVQQLYFAQSKLNAVWCGSNSNSNDYYHFSFVLTKVSDQVYFSLSNNSYVYQSGTSFVSKSTTTAGDGFVISSSTSATDTSSNFAMLDLSNPSYPDTSGVFVFGGVVGYYQVNKLFNCVVATDEVTITAYQSGTVSGGGVNINFDNYDPTGMYRLRHHLTDTNGRSAYIDFVTQTAFTMDEMFYFDTSNMTDNDYYNAGYSNGYNAGLSDGNSSGYSDGYSAGYTAGDAAGFNRGVLDSNDYSFIGLIGSVIDAPIAAFRGLLNFEVFGVDLAPFLLGLFSIALVLIILKKMKGL